MFKTQQGIHTLRERYWQPIRCGKSTRDTSATFTLTERLTTSQVPIHQLQPTNCRAYGSHAVCTSNCAPSYIRLRRMQEKNRNKLQGLPDAPAQSMARKPT